MRLNSQYIRTQLMVQNILKRNAADTTLKMSLPISLPLRRRPAVKQGEHRKKV